MATPVLVADRVSKHVQSAHHTLTIVDNLSLVVEQGESVALVGVSGAGKSTLMSLLSGLDVPSSGGVELLGHRVSTLDSEARAAIRRDSVGFVFQQFLLVPTLSALDNVLLPSMIKGQPGDESVARQLLDQVGLSERAQHFPAQLSGGEQQRVALARSFMGRPQILFADEPTGSLDEKTAASVIDQLFGLNETFGTTLVLVTHDYQLATRCDRIVTMQNGQILEETI